MFQMYAQLCARAHRGTDPKTHSRASLCLPIRVISTAWQTGGRTHDLPNGKHSSLFLGFIFKFLSGKVGNSLGGVNTFVVDQRRLNALDAVILQRSAE